MSQPSLLDTTALWASCATAPNASCQSSYLYGNVCTCVAHNYPLLNLLRKYFPEGFCLSKSPERKLFTFERILRVSFLSFPRFASLGGKFGPRNKKISTPTPGPRAPLAFSLGSQAPLSLYFQQTPPPPPAALTPPQFPTPPNRNKKKEASAILLLGKGQNGTGQKRWKTTPLAPLFSLRKTRKTRL